MASIDQLSIEIEANADKATLAIQKLTSRLTGLNLALNRINTKNITSFAKSMESLSTIGRRTDETSRAVEKFATTLAQSFGIRSKEGIDSVKEAMFELTDANRKFVQSNGRVNFGDKWEQAQRTAANTVKEYARIQQQLDQTTQSVLEYVRATNRGSTKISLSDMAQEFGNNFAHMRAVLGKNFTSQLKSTQQGVQDLAEYLNEMNSVLGTAFDTENVSRGFEQLVEVLERGKNAYLTYNQAVAEGQVREDDAKYAVLGYVDAIDKLVRSEEDLRQNNGIDAIVQSLKGLSEVQVPDFSSFAEAIQALNRVSTDKVVRNIKAVKQALDDTVPSAEELRDKLYNISVDTEGNSTGFITNMIEPLTRAASNASEFAESCKQASSAIYPLQNASAPLLMIEDKMAKAAEHTKQFLESLENLYEVAEETLPDQVEILDNVNGKLEPIKTTVEDIGKNAISTTAKIAEMAAILEKVSAVFNKIGNFGINVFKGIFNTMKNVTVGSFNVLKNFGEYIAGDFKEHVEGMSNAFKNFSKNFKAELTKMSKTWQRIARTFTFMLVRKAITAIIKDVKEAVDELALFERNLGTLSNGKFNTSLSQIVADFHYIGRAIVAAFEPLINYVVPALNAVANAVANVLSLVGEFFAAFTGQDYYVKAKKTEVDYGGELEKDNKKLKERKKLLLKIDEINNLPSKDDSSSSGSGSGVKYKDAFIEKPVSDNMKNLAEKIKGILADLFEPLKKAWDDVKPYLITQFNYLKNQLKGLFSDVWRDFIAVWKQDATVEIFKNLLKILGDLMNVAGNLIKKFRQAWNAITDDGKTRGQSIFEGIRDIIGTLVQHVRNVTKYMKEWSNKITFKPLLSSFDELLKKLNKVAEFLGGVFEDVMKNVVLEHIRYLIEEGLPHLMHAIGEVIDSFDFDDLRQKLVPIEKAFESLRQNIHEGLVNAMKNLGKAIGEWTQTENFQKFLNGIEHFMSKITAERVEKLFTGLGMGILKVVESIADFIGSETFTKFIDDVVAWYDSLSADDIAKWFGGIADGVWKIIEAILQFVDSDAFKGFMQRIIDWYSSLSADDISKFFESIANAIGKVSDVVGAFVSSDIFQSFLNALLNWFNNTDAEDMATQLTAIGGAIAGIKFVAFTASAVAAFAKFAATLKVLNTLDNVGTVLSGASKGISVAGTAIGTAGTTAAAGVGTIAAGAAGLTAGGISIVSSLNQMKDATETYATANTTHSKEVESALENLKKLYEKSPDMAAEWAKTVYDIDISNDSLYEAQNKVWKKIDQEWEDVPQNLFEGLKGGWNEYFGQDGKGLLAYTSDAFTQWVQGIKDLLGIASPSTVFEEIGGYTTEGFENGFTTGWTTVTTDVLTLVGQLITDIGTKFTEIGTGISDKLTPIKTAFETKFGEVKTTVESKIGDAAKAVSTKCGEITKNSKTKLNEFKNTVGEKFKEAKDKIKEKMGDAIDVVRDKLSQMKDKFQKFDLTKMGTNVIRGFLSGLKGAWADVKAWAAQAVADIKSKFAEALQIKSPSRVFMQYGEYTVEGFNIGLEKASLSTSDSIDKWVSSFKDMSVTLAPDITTKSSDGIVKDLLTGGSISSSSSEFKTVIDNAVTRIINSQNSRNINVMVDLDGRRVYEAVVRQDKQQILRAGKSSFAYY